MHEFDAGEFAFNKILSHLQEDGQPAEYLVDFEDYEPEFVEADAFEGCLGVLHAYHRQARVKANLDDPNDFAQMADTAERRLWFNLQKAVRRGGVSRCKPGTLPFHLPHRCEFFMAVSMVKTLQRRGLKYKVNAGEKGLQPAASIAGSFKRLKNASRTELDAVDMWRELSRKGLTDLFGSEAGLYVDGRPRLVPLPGDDEQEAVNAICPSGHLKIACGGFAKNTAVAIMSESAQFFNCHALSADVGFRCRKSSVGVSYPVLVTYNTGNSTISIRYRLCTFASSRAFNTNFSVLGCR